MGGLLCSGCTSNPLRFSLQRSSSRLVQTKHQATLLRRLLQLERALERGSLGQRSDSKWSTRVPGEWYFAETSGALLRHRVRAPEVEGALRSQERVRLRSTLIDRVGRQVCQRCAYAQQSSGRSSRVRRCLFHAVAYGRRRATTSHDERLVCREISRALTRECVVTLHTRAKCGRDDAVRIACLYR